MVEMSLAFAADFSVHVFCLDEPGPLGGRPACGEGFAGVVPVAATLDSICWFRAGSPKGCVRAPPKSYMRTSALPGSHIRQ